MNKYTQAVRPGFAFLAVAMLFLAPTVASASVVKDSPEFSALLAQVKSEAVQLQQTAEEMNTFKFPQIGWQTQADKLEELKTHVNNVGEFVVRMQNVEVPSSSQEQAIRDITPMVEQLNCPLEEQRKPGPLLGLLSHPEEEVCFRTRQIHVFGGAKSIF